MNLTDVQHMGKTMGGVAKLSTFERVCRSVRRLVTKKVNRKKSYYISQDIARQ